MLLLLLACASPKPPVPEAPPALAPTHGVSTGDPRPTSVLAWARLPAAGTLRFAIDGGPSASVAVGPESDFTGTVRLEGLEPGASYTLRAWGGPETPPPEAQTASFRTAPAPETPAAVRLQWSGDLGGQGACRHAERGYPIFDVMAAREPDVFVAAGDLVYADGHCPTEGTYGTWPQVPGPPVATTLEGFRAWWAYNRADAAQQRYLARTAAVVTWDDHEVVNDVDAASPLLPPARQAMVEWNALARDEALNRRLRFGRHLDLFVLDTRGHRDPDAAPDTAEQPKTMLGEAQRAWLVDGVTGSDATWKVVVSSVPLAIPTGRPGARDGWADFDGDTGFAREARALLEALGATRGVVFLTADVHFSAVFRHSPSPVLTVEELVVGPLQAGLFPNDAFDPDLGTERRFFHGPATSPTSFDEALGWFTFGELAIAEDGSLAASIVDANGRALWTERWAAP